jgi:hypothetical protein
MMNETPLERLLRDNPGPRERGYVATQLPASIAGLRTARAVHRRGSAGAPRALAASLAVVAVAAVVVVAALSLRQNGLGPQLGGSPSVAASRSVSASPIPSPSEASGPLPCTADDLSWRADPWTGAAGSRGTNVLFTADEVRGECIIAGRPALELRDANGELLVASEGAGTGADITVERGIVLEIGIAWSNWCGPMPVQPLQITFALPGDPMGLVPLGPPVTDEIPVPPCLGAGQPSALSVTEFQLSSRPPPG